MAESRKIDEPVTFSTFLLFSCFFSSRRVLSENENETNFVLTVYSKKCCDIGVQFGQYPHTQGAFQTGAFLGCFEFCAKSLVEMVFVLHISRTSKDQGYNYT